MEDYNITILVRYIRSFPCAPISSTDTVEHWIIPIELLRDVRLATSIQHPIMHEKSCDRQSLKAGIRRTQILVPELPALAGLAFVRTANHFPFDRLLHLAKLVIFHTKR
jgi:hypothetical protein